MAGRRPKIKVPFDLHPAVTPWAEVALPKVTDLALSPRGVLAVASAGGVTFVEHQAQGDLAQARAQYVTWSEDGARLATLDVEWQGNDMTAYVAVHAWPEGQRLATATMPDWGYVSHATPGALSPMMAFSEDGKRLFVRSATMRDPRGSAIGALDIATGAFVRQALVGEDFLFSIAESGGRVFALYGRTGDTEGLAWLDATTLATKGRVADIAGECVVRCASGMWVIGDDRYVWRVDVGSPEAKKTPAGVWDAARTLRWERLQQLTARARSAWDTTELERRAAMDEAWSPPSSSQRGVRCFMHPEPWAIAQASRMGDDDVIVRDGVRVSRWGVRDGKLDVISLVDDPQRATPQKARITMLSGQRDSFALGWRKALNADETFCTVFRVESATIS
jgi:hypothetical protein